MTGFSKEWLALRECADHRARNPQLRDSVAAFLAGRAPATIVDLACGAGSNLRGLAPFVAGQQKWRLVDHDPRLLAAAKEALAAWADEADACGTAFVKNGQSIEISCLTADLASAPGAALDGAVDLVTAAAFFDLVSAEWLARFCEELARRRLPLYAILTYTGEEAWKPPHPADAAALAAFHAHQARDKGFGRAAGPQAAQLLQSRLTALGYRVSIAASPWRLGQNDAPLIAALAEGAAQAISETGRMDLGLVEEWRDARRRAVACEIGHVDLFAVPG